jgi:hypothetical protein
MFKKFKMLLICYIVLSFSLIPSIATSLEEDLKQENLSGDQQSLSQNFVTFKPPRGWRFVQSKDLPASVKVMVVGQSSSTFPPSMNLGTEKFEGSLKEYLQLIKEINSSQGADWKDLGTIKTLAGNASLSQVDATTEWGEIRMMHVITIRGGQAYILTAAALKTDFPKFYQEFFSALRTLNFTSESEAEQKV